MKKTLNVGAGERTYAFYPTKNFECTNFDMRDKEGIDVVGNVRNLSMFEDEEFDFILASDIIEHFPVAEAPAVLKEWLRVLKPGGTIEFRLPNLAAICKQYFDGGFNARNISWLLYGGQDYEGNYHYTGYDRAFFKDECNKVGLQEITYTETGFNMTIRMRKSNEE